MCTYQKAHLFFLHLMLVGSAFAQPGYQVMYRLQGRGTGEATLLFDGTRSVYAGEAMVNHQSADKTGQIGHILAESTERADASKPVALNKRMVITRDISEHKIVCAEGDTPYHYTVEDEGPEKWNLIQEFRRIGPYNCQKAKTVYKGREYTAWFTAEVPYSVGPWKLAGLPGLILEATSTDKQYQFLYKSCSSAKLSAKQLTIPFVQPKLSYIQYVRKYNQYYQQQVNKIYEETASGFLQRFGIVTVKPITMRLENIDGGLERNFVSASKK